MKVLATPTNALLCLSNFPIWQREHKRLSQNYQKDGTDSQDRTGKEFPPADFTYHYSFRYQKRISIYAISRLRGQSLRTSLFSVCGLDYAFTILNKKLTKNLFFIMSAITAYTIFSAYLILGR